VSCGGNNNVKKEAKMKKTAMLIFLIILSMSFWSFGNTQTQKEVPVVNKINVQELKKMLGNKENFILVDVNATEERHLAGTTDFIPFDTLKSNHDKLPKNKGKKILVYDRDGSTSLEAAEQLAGMGYTNIWNLDGGVLAWKKSGFPVSGPDRIIYLKARQFSFSPDTIKVKQADKIRIIAESLDVAHGFAISEFNINATIERGKKTIIEFIANKKGQYDFVCSVYCGSGHSSMKGKLIVE
jgi:cytochrome c oxidase subunit 2